MKTHFILLQLENEHPIRESTDLSFLLLVQRAILLSLKDTGVLTEMQHRYAEELLKKRYPEAALGQY